VFIGAFHHRGISPARPIIMRSTDGIAWRTLTLVATDNANPGYAGDPTLMRWNGRYWLTHQYSSQGRTRFTLRSSTDLVEWRKVAEVDTGVSGVVEVYPGTWALNEDGSVHLDPRHGRPRLFLTLTTGRIASGPFVLYEMHPVDQEMTIWSSAAPVLGDLPPNVIDPYLIQRGDRWYCWYKSNDPGEETVEYASSESLSGPYRVERSGDWAGWGRRCEAPCLLKLPNSRWRIYLQRYSTRTDGVWFSESGDDWLTWSRLAPVSTDLPADDHLSHGDVIYLPAPVRG
jgi:hypothetical protein